ncbi:MAG: hypothetical protein K8T89_13535 [Planctomycetes bacterium]|nr:hypothetical protein [Planctomycetota bacterium]
MRCVLAIFCLVNLALPSRAAAPPDPLRFIPDRVDLVIKIENPRQFLETLTTLDAVKKAEQLALVRPFLDTPQARRFFEFIAYYERDLGAKWPELLDKLAGGGIVISSKIKDGNDDPVLAVIQGTDEALLKKFVERFSEVIGQDMARVESKEKTATEKYQDFEVLKFGKDLAICRIGTALLFSNKFEALKVGIDQHMENISKGGKPARNMLGSTKLAEGRKLLPPNPQVWLWYGFDYLKAQQGAKDLLKSPRDNTILTFLFAGYLDVFRRADYLAVGLYASKDNLSLSLRMPAGRDGMAEDCELHLPRDPKIGGTLPLLEPAGVIFTHSFYLDVGTLWTKRDKVMTASNVKDFEKGVKDASRVLLGTSLDKLLTQSGVHHRLVAAQRPPTAGYKIEPQIRLPAFAYVTTSRDPAFAKSVEVLIRGGVAFASTQVTVKMFEEKHGDISYFGYRFPEDGKFPNDPQNFRFNFTPCYAVVKDQLVFASTREFCKEMIDIVLKEDRKPQPENMQMKGYARGLADLLNASPDQLLTQTILSQAIPEAEAKKQVEQLLNYIRGLGEAKIATDYTANEFRFDIGWKLKD